MKLQKRHIFIVGAVLAVLLHFKARRELEHIGYIPRYYSKIVSNFIKESNKYECQVLEINKAKNCNECIKAKLVLNTDN